MMIWTSDVNLSAALHGLTSYFNANISNVISVFIAVAGFLWLLRFGLRSMGVVSPAQSDFVGEDWDHTLVACKGCGELDEAGLLQGGCCSYSCYEAVYGSG